MKKNDFSFATKNKIKNAEFPVLILQDAYTSFYEAPMVLEILLFLRKLGLNPLVLPYRESGKSWHVRGFTKKFATFSAEEFIKDLLIKKIGMKAIIVGEDYTFGKNREGNLAVLKSYAAQMDYEVVVAAWIKATRNASQRISSTRIRKLVMAGKIEAARKMLGRHYQIRGLVVKGRDRGGKLLGIPTANINLQDELCPKTGIYAVTVEHQNRLHKGVANIGYSPTFSDNEFTVEVHILDFNKDIYDHKIRVNFIERIRNEKKFDGISELKDQIHQDIGAARKILATFDK